MFAHWKQKMVWLWAMVLLPTIVGLWWALSTAHAQAPFSINYGEVQTGEVVDRLGDEWVFSGCLSDVVTITMQSPLFGSYLQLYGPVGRDSLAQVGVEGPDAPAVIGGYSLPESGPFTIIAAGANIRDRGAYTLTLDAEGAVAANNNQIVGLVGDGDVVTGTVETRLGEAWGFRGCLHDTVSVKVESDDFVPFVAVYAPGGGEESLVEMSGADHVALIEDLILPTSGQYVIMAAGASIRDRGTYTLTFQVIDRVRPTATPTPTPTGTITPPPTATPTPIPPPPTATPTRANSGGGGNPGGGNQTPLCVVQANLLNLRPGPGTEYAPPIGAAPERNALLVPLNRNSSTTWIRVQVVPNGPTGWVSAAPQFVSCNINISHLPLGVIPPTPTATTATTTVTATYTPTPTGTWNTPTYTPTYTPTPTGTYDTPTYTPTPTETSTSTDTPTVTPTGTYDTPTVTSTPTDTETPTVTATPTDTETPTTTPTPTDTETPTPTTMATDTETPTPTDTVNPTETPTPTETVMASGSNLPTTGYQVYPPGEQLGDLVGTIWVPENYGTPQEPVFHDWLYFEAYVYDPIAGNYTGAGINSVDFAVYPESGGNKIFSQHEQNERYCIFGGGEPDCTRAQIKQNAKWPGTNKSLDPGRYRIVIEAHPSNNGRTGAHWEGYFQIYGQNNNNQPLHAEFVQTGANNNNDSINGAIVFQVLAYDPNVGNQDGDGIDYVLMQIFHGNNKVYERKEQNVHYCAFSGGEPDCNIWFFNDHNNEWPNGDPVQSDQYTLRARVKAKNGQEKTIERQIMISP